MGAFLTVGLVGLSNLFLWIVAIINLLVGLAHDNKPLLWSAFIIFITIIIFGVVGIISLFSGG